MDPRAYKILNFLRKIHRHCSCTSPGFPVTTANIARPCAGLIVYWRLAMVEFVESSFWRSIADCAMHNLVAQLRFLAQPSGPT